MSGGSFDYLCYKDAKEILEDKEQLIEMFNYLREKGKLDMADEIEKLYLDLVMFERMINNRLKRLNNILYAVEWWASGDIGEWDLYKAWEEFLKGSEDAELREAEAEYEEACEIEKQRAKEEMEYKDDPEIEEIRAEAMKAKKKGGLLENEDGKTKDSKRER